MSFYQHPEVYAVLLWPEADLVADVEQWIRKYEVETQTPGDAVPSVMDPACGPGTWLEIVATNGSVVAGNDLEPCMIEAARRRLAGWRAELRIGDMRELHFQTGPFDVALNLHSSIGHLPDDDAVVAHLESVARCLRPGGLYLLGLMIDDGSGVSREPEVIFQTPPTKLPGGGMAAVRYESVWRDPHARRERIRLRLLTKGVPDCPEVLNEEYDLRTFSARCVRELLGEAGGWELVAVHAMLVEGRPEVGLTRDAGDVTLILRRTEAED